MMGGDRYLRACRQSMRPIPDRPRLGRVSRVYPAPSDNDDREPVGRRVAVVTRAPGSRHPARHKAVILAGAGDEIHRGRILARRRRTVLVGVQIIRMSQVSRPREHQLDAADAVSRVDLAAR